MKKFFLVSFLPTNVDLGLLVLRLVFGGSLLALHGWGKLIKFSSMFDNFPDPIGIGNRASYLLATGGEVLGALFVVLGLFTRFGALWAGSVMAVAFFVAHGMKLSGQGSGELAMLFLAGFLTLFITGGGRYSFDAQLGAK